VGEPFEGLDLLTKLLTSNKPSKPKSSGILIEEISSNNNENPEEDANQRSEEEIEEGDEWFIEQSVNPDHIGENEIDLNSISVKYGFAQTKANVFSKLSVSHKNFKIKSKKIIYLLYHINLFIKKFRVNTV
jgi:hypothetical protein